MKTSLLQKVALQYAPETIRESLRTMNQLEAQERELRYTRQCLVEQVERDMKKPPF